MVRELGEFDVDACQRVLRWPLRDALLAYLHLLVVRAETSYQTRRFEWLVKCVALKKPGRAPAVPPILKRLSRGDT